MNIPDATTNVFVATCGVKTVLVVYNDLFVMLNLHQALCGVTKSPRTFSALLALCEGNPPVTGG